MRPHCVQKGTNENMLKPNQIEMGRGLFLRNPQRVQRAEAQVTTNDRGSCDRRGLQVI